MAIWSAPQQPWRCQYGHPLCKAHGETKVDPIDLPGYDRIPPAGVCFYGCVSRHLWQTPKDRRYLCRHHLRQALHVGGYPVGIE